MKNALLFFFLVSACSLFAENPAAFKPARRNKSVVTPQAPADTSHSLLSEIDSIQAVTNPMLDKPKRIYNTFGGTHLINGQSVETINKKTMAFIIAHRFGRVNGGWREFFGLDQASIRFGFEYGILDNLTVGFGRSTFNKTFDGYVKYRFLTQKEKGMPLSMCFYSNMAINSSKFINQSQHNYFSSRLSFVFQLMIARKFNDWFSLQLMPTVVHKNLVATEQDKNTLFVLGAGFKVKLSKRMAFLGEYYLRIKDNKLSGNQDAFAIGLDVVTGGHVFQFQVTNAQAMYDTGFMRETTGRFWKGDIHFGFNISRTWGVGKQAKLERKEKHAKKKMAKADAATPHSAP
ncbi:MAG: hypothetical protein JWN78_2923 [Bacteroidota bacterium]|nr:hypothetical protein [Bacteroidota bacterium]